MDVVEYAARQRTIIQRVLGFFARILRPYLEPALTPDEWITALEDVYPTVEEVRRESAILAREFYDDVRERNGLMPNDVFRAGYEFSWFEEAMEPARRRLSRPGADETDLEEAVSRIVKEVENAGRKTIIRAVQSEPEDSAPPGAVIRWARVATGRETCGFCLMLVSRGPVYLEAESAGLDADDTTAADLFAQGDEEALNGLMTRWHPNCDCKVVPVYDLQNWEGRDAYLRADQIWRDVTQGLSGKDALNAFRRAVERGDVEVDDFSIAA